ncbi:hypothetical protein JW978_02570 [Candidatus Dojkabacteria bacterium]|nr:hypothetical protein [Candidatus Dojkabacteria bacterium]
MRKCEISNKTANFGKTRRHRRGSAGGVSGAWSKKATAKSKKQGVNLKKVRALDSAGAVKSINVSMKAYKKARKNEGRLSTEYILADFREELAK